jgi:two-component system phosphate regulon sensor histidine kinase PhoR
MDLDRLATLVKTERQALLARWREQVRAMPSARHLDIPTLNDHLPGLLDELVEALETHSDQTILEALAEPSPRAHGRQRLAEGFDIEEVVAEYNILRGCLHDLADERGLTLQGKPFRILNRVFDQAIGTALETYATERALDVRRRREEYLSFVAHDLRTPLNAISLAATVLEQTLGTLDPSDNGARMLKALRRSVKQLAALVTKVLEENINLETELGVKVERRELDLWPLVEALIHDLHPVAGTSSVRLVNEVTDEQVVYADASLLGRVLQNLIANAIRYTPKGEIVIGARAIEAEGVVECWVRDNGAGIPAALVERVFDRGETDPDMAGGAGLGLAIVKTFVEAHGGRVSVESREGVGSTFTFSLPMKARASKVDGG